MDHIHLQDIVNEFNLTLISKDTSLLKSKITTKNVNRPGLHLLGFFDTFDTNRVQVFGRGEMAFLSTLNSEERKIIFKKFFNYSIPCVIIARGLSVFEEMLECAEQCNVPILKTEKDTPTFISQLISYLNYELAQTTSIHGGLVEVYGEGVLILGESGIGKSEVALELIKRGHGFIADDVVEVKRIAYNILEGQAPEIIKYFIEIRGVGLIDVARIFGMGSIKNAAALDMVVNLELWDSNKEYDRLGEEDQKMDILGVKLPCVTIPVKPGRNVAVIVESAVMNLRQKSLGYNAAKVLNKRVNAQIKNKMQDKKKHKKIIEN